VCGCPRLAGYCAYRPCPRFRSEHCARPKRPIRGLRAAQIEALGCEGCCRKSCSGYRIDMGCRHPEWPYGFILGRVRWRELSLLIERDRGPVTQEDS